MNSDTLVAPEESKFEDHALPFSIQPCDTLPGWDPHHKNEDGSTGRYFKRYRVRGKDCNVLHLPLVSDKRKAQDNANKWRLACEREFAEMGLVFSSRSETFEVHEWIDENTARTMAESVEMTLEEVRADALREN